MLVLPPPSLVPDRVSSSVISNGGGSRPRSREDALVGRSGLTECDIRYGNLGSVLLFWHLPTRALLSRFFFGRALGAGLIHALCYSLWHDPLGCHVTTTYVAAPPPPPTDPSALTAAGNSSWASNSRLRSILRWRSSSNRGEGVRNEE